MGFNPGEMLIGLGMAETTPDPLPDGLSPLMTATLAGLLVTWVTFTPTLLPLGLSWCAPYVEALCGVRALGAALSAVTAAVVGFIVNLAVWFGIHVIFRDIFVWQGFGFNLSIPVLSSLAIAAAVAIFRCKVGIMHTLLACSLAGVALQLAFGVAS